MRDPARKQSTLDCWVEGHAVRFLEPNTGRMLGVTVYAKRNAKHVDHLTHGIEKSDAYLSVEGRAWVLFHSKDVEVKGCLEFGVCYVSLVEPETSWADESFILRSFSRETFPDEGDLTGQPDEANARENRRVSGVI